jgi:hypothetical protein
MLGFITIYAILEGKLQSQQMGKYISGWKANGALAHIAVFK